MRIRNPGLRYTGITFNNEKRQINALMLSIGVSTGAHSNVQVFRNEDPKDAASSKKNIKHT
jgi:hypothetical protein